MSPSTVFRNCFLLLGLFSFGSMAAIDTTLVRTTIDQMISRLNGVKNVKDVVLEEQLSSIPFKLVGIYQKASLKTYKGDEDFLDDVIGSKLIRPIEKGQVCSSNFRTDTFIIREDVSNRYVVNIYTVYNICKKAQLLNGTPIYVFAGSIVSKQATNFNDEDEARTQLREQQAAMEPFLKYRKLGDNLRSRNAILFSTLAYQSFKNELRNNYIATLRMHFDTTDITKDSLDAMRNQLRDKYKDDYEQLDSLNAEIAAIDQKRKELFKTAIVIGGEVQNKQGTQLTVYGSALLYNTINPESGLMGMMASSYTAAFEQAFSQSEEEVLGLVEKDGNLIIEGYSVQQKFTGTGSIGSSIIAGPYAYKSQTKGRNQIGGIVPIFHYIPHPNLNAVTALKAETDSLSKNKDVIVTNISTKEAALLTPEEQGLFK